MSLSASLVLLPGLMCDARIFAPQVDALAGDVAITVGDYRLADSLAEMARRVLDQSPPRFALAGHSMGARVALEVYRMAPERVERIALLSTGVHRPRNGESEKRHALLDIGRTGGIEALIDAWLPPMVAPAHRADAALMAALRTMCRSGGVDLYAAQIAALLDRPEVEPLLPSIRCPALVAVGDADTWSPLDQHRAIADAIPRAALVAIAGSGHMVPLEAPDQTTAALRAWLATPAIPTPSTGDN